MDGRVQRPVAEYLRWHYGTEFVDMVTDAGPVGVLATHGESDRARRLLHCVEVSLKSHQSRLVAVVAHHDCAGYRASEAQQKKSAQVSASLLTARFRDVKVVPLWVGRDWRAVPMIEPATG